MELNDPILTPEEVKEPTLNQELNAEVAETPAQSEQPSAQSVMPEHTVRRSLTKPEILEEVTRLSQLEAAEIPAEDVARLKQQFYSLRNEDVRAERGL